MPIDMNESKSTTLTLPRLLKPMDLAPKVGKLYTVSENCIKGTAWAGEYPDIKPGDMLLFVEIEQGPDADDDEALTLTFLTPAGVTAKLWMTSVRLFSRFVDFLTPEEWNNVDNG